MLLNPVELRKIILEKLPEGCVEPCHTEKGHFYKVVSHGGVYPSVTGRLQILKDEGLMNYKMNRAVDYVFTHFKEFNDLNVTEHLEKAKNLPSEIFRDAADIGTRIHGYREDYFNACIAAQSDSRKKNNGRPAEALAFIPAIEVDVRATSAMRALQKFVTDNFYIPVASELLVYDDDLRLAGTLDDVGIMR